MKKISALRRQKEQRAEREEALASLHHIMFNQIDLKPRDGVKEAWNHFKSVIYPAMKRIETAQTLVLEGEKPELAWTRAEKEWKPTNNHELIKEWECVELMKGPEAMEKFSKWFDAVKIDQSPTRMVDFVANVSCSPYQNDVIGNGLEANVEIEPQDVILDVPRRACITSDLDDFPRNSKVLAETWKKLPHLELPLNHTMASVFDKRRWAYDKCVMHHTPLQSLTSLILVFRLLWECALPLGCSVYAPYLAILPDEYNVPLNLSLEELEEFPSLNMGLTAARIAGETLAHLRQYSMLFQVLSRQDAQERAIPLSLFTWQRFRWALGATMTRKNPIPAKQDPEDFSHFAFIPGYDLANHERTRIHVEASTECVYSTESNSVQLYATRHFSKGQQVFIRYDVDRPTEITEFLGNDPKESVANPKFTVVRSFSAWLTNGGFVPDVERFVKGNVEDLLQDGLHPADTMLLRVTAPEIKDKDHAKLLAEVLQRIRFTSPITIALCRPPIWATSAPLMAFLRLTQATKEELIAFNDLVNRDLEEMQKDSNLLRFANTRCMVPMTLGKENEKRALSWLKSRCELMLKQSIASFAKRGANQDETTDDEETLKYLDTPPSTARDVTFVGWRDRKLLRAVIKECERLLTNDEEMRFTFESLNVNPSIAVDVKF